MAIGGRPDNRPRRGDPGAGATCRCGRTARPAGDLRAPSGKMQFGDLLIEKTAKFRFA